MATGHHPYDETECGRTHRLLVGNQKTNDDYERFLCFEAVENVCRRLLDDFGLGMHHQIFAARDRGQIGEDDVRQMKTALAVCRPDLGSGRFDELLARPEAHMTHYHEQAR